jgi:tetratricopeptide (TPR) repeat protein
MLSPAIAPLMAQAALKSAGDDQRAAVREYRRIARYCRRLRDPLGEAEAWQRAAGMSWQRSDQDSAAAFHEHAAHAFLRAGAARKARDELTAAALLVYLDQPDQALAWIQEALDTGSRSGRNKVRTLIDAGFVNHACGNFDEATESYALAVAGSGLDSKTEERVNTFLGAFYATQGSEWMEEVAATAGLDRNQTWNLVCRGRSADSLALTEDSTPKSLRAAASDSYDSLFIRYRRESDSAWAEGDTFTWQMQLTLAADCYIDAGMADSAVRILRRVLSVEQGSTWAGMMPGAYDGLANAYRKAGMPDSALSYVVRADSIRASFDMRDDTGMARWRLHLLYRRIGESRMREIAERLRLDPETTERLLRKARVAERLTGG